MHLAVFWIFNATLRASEKAGPNFQTSLPFYSLTVICLSTILTNIFSWAQEKVFLWEEHRFCPNVRPSRVVFSVVQNVVRLVVHNEKTTFMKQTVGSLDKTLGDACMKEKTNFNRLRTNYQSLSHGFPGFTLHFFDTLVHLTKDRTCRLTSSDKRKGSIFRGTRILPVCIFNRQRPILQPVLRSSLAWNPGGRGEPNMFFYNTF